MVHAAVLNTGTLQRKPRRPHPEVDTITHSLLGALTVRAMLPARGEAPLLNNRQRMITGAVAGAFPDIDYIMSWVDPMIYLAQWHRGITHSLVLLPLWALFVGVLMAVVLRRYRAWPFLALLAGVSVLSHILSDLITTYGTQIFSPLSGWRASLSTTFVIDPWFSLIVLVGCIAGLRHTSGSVPAVSLFALLAYVALQANLKMQALGVAKAHARESGVPAKRVSALPQPFSPFNWKLIIESPDHYDVAYLSLNGGYDRSGDDTGFWSGVRLTYRERAALDWRRQPRFGGQAFAALPVAMIWDHPELDYFRRFAEFPALYRVDREGAETCVWFTDLRYVLPYMTPPFRYGMCRERRQPEWRLNRLGYGEE